MTNECIEKPILAKEAEEDTGEYSHKTRYIRITQAAVDALDMESIREALSKHFRDEWGPYCPRDKDFESDRLVVGDAHKFSVHRGQGGVKFWVITEWDGTEHIVLLPGDY